MTSSGPPRARTALGLIVGAALAAAAVPALASPAFAAGPPSAAAGSTTGAPSHPGSAQGIVSSLLGGSIWGDDTTKQGAKASAGGPWQAKDDLGSMWNTDSLVGAQSAWSQRDASGRPVTGTGVTVAVVDTGITPVAGLDGAGKVVNGPDLSFDSQSTTTAHLDGFGHGTFMAGIIAGHDASKPLSDPNSFNGVAPGAQLLNMKVASADGGADVSQVVAAIDWVVQHKTDNGMNVRVINLSYGTDSTQSYTVDPLAKAVEDAWKAGIVVVSAAGNEGSSSTSLTMPAADPYGIAVGASDHEGTASALDDQVASFTNAGSSSRDVDVLAPGKSVVSLRVPGSQIDVDHPEGLVTGDASGRYFRGSGTSEATAVVSGVAALLLQKDPGLTADQVKQALTSTSSPLVAQAVRLSKAGRVSAASALSVVPALLDSRQTWTPSTGLGSLNASRGGSDVVDPTSGTALTGEVDAVGGTWNAAAWAKASGAHTAWTGGTFDGRTWTGDHWVGSTWASATWTGSNWTGADWTSHRWSGESWDSHRWSGSGWQSSSWSGADWSSHRWSGARWS